MGGLSIFDGSFQGSRKVLVAGSSLALDPG
jgi:hypothetical protein